ncbi:cytoplasmic protein [Cryptococcus gattii Ru294]|uniref:Vacuolar import and degradation protein, putative n=2 Tax=Cryptococcus gattii TaxID=37769 RepID=E6R746_CRYGW|nr:Vacuolar import and degradation protein, putative [Cryptococcus gattii WM276]KIR51721.1 cytoplasmic protein [Cryptococcus gattii Ru294]KIR78402.1 cytoplasmic protein [Cryptococcus gattii EJB2]KIY33204.1 cytoplasmic protein [Cryptococcus gattii E566]KJE00898.1 cytoplasmic protein [Cryptococcus gattii NT-10]ADV22507.1 Vacuolar import and degradation protein, putative [Cryptococcus gattii WM276]
MFVLKSLLGKMWGNPANPELIQIPAGLLYLVRPDSIKGSRECIFQDAVATIRRTGTEYQYQLVVTRAYEEGEEQLLDEDAETDDERVFLIDQGLQFRFGTLDGDATCSWKDLSGEEGDRWEFVSSKSVPKATNSLFELTLLHCMFERKYLRSHEEATDEQLQALKYTEEHDIPKAAARPEDITLETQLSSLGLEDSEDPFQNVPILHRASADLYVFDTETELFVIQESNVSADLAENAEFDTWIIVRQGTTPFISAPVDAELNAHFDMVNHALMFTFREGDGVPAMTWCLRFKPDCFNEWKDRFTIYMWEGKNKVKYAKAKADEQRYIQEAYEDIEMAEPEEEEVVNEEENEAEDGEGHEDSAHEDEDNDSGDESFAQGSKNQHLAVGYKNDLSYVTRGDMIGVFAHNGDRLKFRTAIDRIKNVQGKAFSPHKMMLHNQDSDMLLLDPSNKGAVYRMDLEYGKVVDEWKVSDVVAVNNIIPDTKYAQMNPQQTLIGHSHNGIFRIDPRVSGNKLVESQFKQYASKNDFSAATTTESGKLVVASNKGDIRLFDQIGKNAKTALPALGDPIIGVDVSADGRWLVATCKNYLLLIDTLIGDGRYKGSLGFDRSFPADSKPIPRRLQLKPEHVAYMEDPVSFTPARFNTGIHEAEKSIVTSTGNYVITWNFRMLKQGRTDAYQIKRYDSRVVADNFKFGADKNIIVALEHNVLVANKKDLAKPTRSSLAPNTLLSTPARKIRQSHSDIVNSPY